MKIKFDYNKETGETTAILTVKDGQRFYGFANYNNDAETLAPSYMFGMRLAEYRAYLKYYKYKLKTAKVQYNGLQRAEAAVPAAKKEVLHYIHGAMKAVALEIEEYKDNIDMLNKSLDQALKDRELYIRSRSISPKERAEQKKKIDEAFRTFEKAKKDLKDKND